MAEQMLLTRKPRRSNDAFSGNRSRSNSTSIRSPRQWPFLALLLLTGCPASIRRPAPEGVPARPAFERTYGDIQVTSSGHLFIRYRDIRLYVAQSAKPLAVPDPSTLDYLLLTGPERPVALDTIRKNQKIIAGPGVADTGPADSFANVKTVQGSQRLLLRKKEGFIFLSGVPSDEGGAAPGFLLEFDNGRNILILGPVGTADSLREFMYGLRDDGKELALAFLPDRPVAGEQIVQQIALLQPRIGLVLGADGERASRSAALTESLKKELFYGDVYLPSPGEVIPF